MEDDLFSHRLTSQFYLSIETGSGFSLSGNFLLNAESQSMAKEAAGERT